MFRIQTVRIIQAILNATKLARYITYNQNHSNDYNIAIMIWKQHFKKIYKNKQKSLLFFSSIQVLHEFRALTRINYPFQFIFLIPVRSSAMLFFNLILHNKLRKQVWTIFDTVYTNLNKNLRFYILSIVLF